MNEFIVGTWNHYSKAINATEFWLDNVYGDSVTDDQIQAVLSQVTNVEIIFPGNADIPIQVDNINIGNYIPETSRIADIGGGPGRYSFKYRSHFSIPGVNNHLLYVGRKYRDLGKLSGNWSEEEVDSFYKHTDFVMTEVDFPMRPDY